MKVLLTDDSATIRMILKGLLKQLQITEISEAQDGQEALNILKTKTVDVVMLDIHMPTLDGLQCLEQIRKMPGGEKIPVIMITSDTDSKQIERAHELGAHAYIKKPFRIDGLREALATVIPDSTNKSGA